MTADELRLKAYKIICNNRVYMSNEETGAYVAGVVNMCEAICGDEDKEIYDCIVPCKN